MKKMGRRVAPAAHVLIRPEVSRILYGTTRKKRCPGVIAIIAGLAVPTGCQSTPAPTISGLANKVPPAGVQETLTCVLSGCVIVSTGRAETKLEL